MFLVWLQHKSWVLRLCGPNIHVLEKVSGFGLIGEEVRKFGICLFYKSRKFQAFPVVIPEEL